MNQIELRGRDRNGQIIGAGLHNGQARRFLLTPVMARYVPLNGGR